MFLSLFLRFSGLFINIKDRTAGNVEQKIIQTALRRCCYCNIYHKTRLTNRQFHVKLVKINFQMKNLHKSFFLPLLLIAIILLASVGYLYQSNQSAVISGSIDLNGVIPDKSSISIQVKKQDDSNFRTIVKNLTAENGVDFEWQGATKGVGYEIVALLQSEGKDIGTSSALRVTAPATGETLVINSTYKPTPQAAPQSATISGGIDLNGAVTTQSSVSLYQKLESATEFSLVTDQISARDGVNWSFDQAIEGEAYTLKAVLYVDGQYMGESPLIEVTAPATDEMLRINSQYSAPPEKATVSGSFNINGPIPSNTIVTVYKQGQGDTSFVKLFDMPASNGVQWSWTGAVQGAQYQMKASLWNNNNDLGDSQVIVLTAPASNETFIINYNVPGKAAVQPPNSPTVQCVSQSGNSWTANLNFQSVAGANTYWLQVGAQSGGNNIVNTQVGSNGQTSQTYTMNNINNGSSYFAQYAASTCVNCTASNQYSPFSNTLQFTCQPQSPTATPTPFPQQPTYTPTPTSTPLPTSTPTPTLPPRTSSCNQTCGSNGYSCVIGLQCVSGNLPGSQVCRNPNCTDQTDCTCN